jgi:hypothetical protein
VTPLTAPKDDGPTGVTTDYNAAFEMRTTAGPSRQVQCVLRDSPDTVASQMRQCQEVVAAAAEAEAGGVTDEPWLRRENGSGIASVGPVRQ